MSEFKRRKFLKTSAGVAAAAAVGPMIWIKDANAQWTSKPEKGAKLRVLRWSRFVQGDIDQYMKNVAKFTEKFGIDVRVDNEGWEDVRPKAAVAANTGAGPDIILSTNDDANLYPEKLVDVTDVCNYLGTKYGGWYPVCDQYLKPDGKKWIGVPLGCAGSALVYRASMLKAAGFDKVARDTDGFLKLCKALKEKNTPVGFALGNATGDGNTWTNWVMWAFGGKMVDANNKVVIDSPETIKALEYAKELYATFVPGTLSWLDINNNNAFLDSQISLTSNGISVYFAAKNATDPKVKDLEADIFHSNFPVGPISTTRSSRCSASRTWSSSGERHHSLGDVRCARARGEGDRRPARVGRRHLWSFRSPAPVPLAHCRRASREAARPAAAVRKVGRGVWRLRDHWQAGAAA